eukprot:CAMPEP_0194131668 /NCGR_PEP_ID=MMETSP0152-20130528/2394_1 /TAXON_ID=1049557 /ORGANISM="Thalassiothrix antarctica, Strain L6-D1" /LENGTH=582 /DNA_ID=CAMNT_0038826529 /DNA_START=70 /DNA_END=1818 /DNA_ORIENTATION=+
MNLTTEPSLQPTGDYVDLHELAKGWKAAMARATDPETKIESRVKNDRGNLPLHSAASFRAPLEVQEALLDAYPEAASSTNNYGNLALHFTAWKKGPLEVEKLLLKIFPEGAAQKNNHGNLPLHYAAHYNAPLEVVEALYHAYPEGASQKNNDNNTPLDLAIADGASPNVVALLQGKSVPPTDDEVLEGAKARCERMEKEMQRNMEKHDSHNDDLELVLAMLMDIRDTHPHSLYSAGINPNQCGDLDGMLEQVRKAGAEDNARAMADGGDELAMYSTLAIDEEDEAQMVEDAMCPPDDEIEVALAQLIGFDALKNQIRGLRRTLEMDGNKKVVPRHMTLVGNTGTNMETVARTLLPLLYKMGAVKNSTVVEVSRDDMIDRKSEARTVFKSRRVLEKAAGGVLFINEAYTLLPSTARPRARDHGGAALREIARSLPTGSPLIIMSGNPKDMQRILTSEIGFKGHFLTRLELPDPTPQQIARTFMSKLNSKGLIAGEGVNIPYLAELIETNTDEDWRLDRQVSDLLLQGVRAEMRKRLQISDDESRSSISPMRLMSGATQRMPSKKPEEIYVSVEDLQNAIVNGM